MPRRTIGRRTYARWKRSSLFRHLVAIAREQLVALLDAGVGT